MTPATFKRVRELFAAVRDLPPGERAEILDRECGVGANANAIRVEVQSLLAQLEKSGPVFLETPAVAPKPAHFTPQSGETFGAYRLGQVLGEGGMGIVYEAEQDHPRRTVALKLIRPLFVSPSLLRRFEYEADVLARLEHPGIARIYEAGTFDTPTGKQPFFAMELVRGKPLRDYIAEKKPSTHARLELLRRICDAVQHAHQKSVIHRDLKPTNILVTADGEPKILDFGVARAIDSDVQSIATMNTQTGQLVGTLPYMSPEQVSGDVNGIDTRSDVYALGVIAYELLADRLPYAVKDKPIPEAARIIREDEPGRLSMISADCRGDVETIVAKALQKEKERRYVSAGAMAADITHYLNYEPISARPPSATYQISRFARRHKALVGGLIAVGIVLVLGMAATSWQLLRAKRAEASMRAEKEAAENAVATKREAAEFVDSILRSGDFGDSQVTVGKLLDEQVRELDKGKFASQPTVESEIRQMIGSQYVELGKLAEAETQLRLALTARQRGVTDPSTDPFTLQIMKRLIVAVHGQGRIDEALSMNRDLLNRSRRLLGGNHPETIEQLKSVGAILLRQGKAGEAKPYVDEAIERAESVLPEDHPLRLNTESLSGGVAIMLGHADEAEQIWRELLPRFQKVVGDDDDSTLRLRGNLAMAQNALGRPEEAEPNFRELLMRYRRKLGADHATTLDVQLKLAIALVQLKRFTEAEPLMRDAMQRYRAALGEDHPDALNAQLNLSMVLKRLNRLDEAEALLRDLIARYRRTLSESDPATLQATKLLEQLRTTLPATTRSLK